MYFEYKFVIFGIALFTKAVNFKKSCVQFVFFQIISHSPNEMRYFKMSINFQSEIIHHYMY